MQKIKSIRYFVDQNLTSYLLALILSSLMFGYALSSIALGIFVGYSIIKGLYLAGSFKMDYKLLFPILFFVFFSLTYFWSIDKDLTLKGIGRMMALFLVPLAFSFISKINKKELDFILDVFTKTNVCVGVFFIITSLLRYLNSGLISEFYYHNLVSDLDLSAIFVSAFYILSFFYLLIRKQKKLFDKISLVFLFILIVLLSSKIITFCLILGILIYVIRVFKPKMVNLYKIIIVLTLGFGIFVLSSKEIILRVKEETKTNIYEILNKEQFNQIYPWTGTSIRLLQLRILKEQIEQEHIFWKGFGLFASRVDLIKQHKRLNTYEGFHNYNYHNMYAQTLSESGIIGFIILLVLLITNFINAIRSKSFLFLMFNILIILWFLTESVLWVQRGLFFFVIFYCLFNRAYFNDVNNEIMHNR